jgi:type 1 glutamine amidotransferase
MKKSAFTFQVLRNTALLSLIIIGLCSWKKPMPKLLVFSKTAAFHHSSIPVGIQAIQLLGKQNGFEIDTTTNAALFTKKNLKQYDALIFLSPTGNLFNEEEKEALQHYIHKGGGIVGIHSATDAEYHWPWYNQMIGAYFSNHPAQQMATIIVNDSTHLATKGLPTIWTRKDEWYNFKDISTDIHVLLSMDEKSYKGGTNGANHPMSWYHEFEGGRVFYTALGHTNESYTEPLFLQHILGGINYAMGRH